MDDVKHTTDDFIQYFDPMAYLQEYHPSLEGRKASAAGIPWVMEQLHDIFERGNIKAERMLDVGTGPSIHCIISAAPHCDTMFLSDVTPQCRDVLHQWLNNTLPHSFKSFFKFVVDKEDKGESPQKRETKLRKKIAGILPIDILKAQPLEPCLFSKFQLITSFFCFATAANNIGLFNTAARNVDSLLEEGGHIVFANFLHGTPYQVGKYTFDSCNLTSEDSRSIWEQMGYDIVEYKEHKEDFYLNGKYRMGGYNLLVAQKPEN